MATARSPGVAARSSRTLSSALAGVVVLVPVAAAVHYANEYADVETDALTDRTPFSGGSGALDRTGLPASFLRAVTAGASGVAGIALLAVHATAGLPGDAFVFLLAIYVAGLAYSLPPIAFVRRGVGEAVNAILGGLLLPLYGVAVVSTPGTTDALAVLPFSLLVGCNLVATHWPDREADAAVGKRTLAVRWSASRLRGLYAVLALTAAAVTAGLWAGNVVPDAVVLAHLLPVPLLAWGWRVVTRQRSPLPSVLAMVVLAVGATVAWWAVAVA